MSFKEIREKYYKNLIEKCHKRHGYKIIVEQKIEINKDKNIDWEKLSSFIKKPDNFKKMPDDFMPEVSDNFQIGYDGAYEHDI